MPCPNGRVGSSPTSATLLPLPPRVERGFHDPTCHPVRGRCQPPPSWFPRLDPAAACGENRSVAAEVRTSRCGSGGIMGEPRLRMWTRWVWALVLAAAVGGCGGDGGGSSEAERPALGKVEAAGLH